MTITTNAEVLQGLQGIRVRRRLMWSAWVSHIPVSYFLFEYYEGKIAAVLFAAWFALELGLSAVVMFSKCPRCNRLFHRATFGSDTGRGIASIAACRWGEANVRVRLYLYKTLTLLWAALLIAAMFFATYGVTQLGLAALLSATFVILVQALLIRCPYCHTRPGIWILAIWMLLVDLECYIADVLLLRTCPRCGRSFF